VEREKLLAGKMYSYVDANIFDSPAQTLVNTVNTSGAMGKGLALQFKRLFPKMFEEYQKLCETGRLKVGELWLYHTPHKRVLNFPTKKHWRNPSKLDYVEKGLRAFVGSYQDAGITSVAFPKLGCGNGELPWREVKPLMERYLRALPIDVYVYVSKQWQLPEHRDIKTMRAWLMTEPKHYPFCEFKADLESLVRTVLGQSKQGGRELRAELSDEGMILPTGQGGALIPWQGDETGLGWLELWQFIKDRKLLTEYDLRSMGFEAVEHVFQLLLRLPYFRRFRFGAKNRIMAVQLMPATADADLFAHTESVSDYHQL
jgi:O-acetyl-ADP-ribose deacetylase (regulator of RNase III)